MKLKKVIVSIILIITLAFTTINSFADVGGHQRYSSGSSSSSSSSSSRRSSSSSSSSRYRSSGSSSGGIAVGTGGSAIGIIIFIIVLIIITNARKKGALNHVINYNNINSTPVMNNTRNVEQQIKQIDPMFSAEKFLSWSKEVFIKLQAAWTKRDWNQIRPFESNELFAQHEAQLQEFIDNGKINVVERVAVRQAELYSFVQDGDKETLTITLNAVMRDYIIDEKTKAVLEGNKNQDMYMTYKLTFIRKAGIKTKEGTDSLEATNCPNCGAPTQITSAGQCEYCGSVITTGEHDWVLANLEGI